jgi:hypothetical protein
VTACDLCGAPSNGYECDWPVEEFRARRARDLRLGDIICRKSRKRSRGIATVTAITRRTSLSILIELTIAWPWKTRTRIIDVRADWSILVKSVAACANHICDGCMIERDPERMVICRDHWFAWEKVD